MSTPRSGDRLLIVWVLLVAVLLQLPAHVGWNGGPVGREALYEDGPVLVSNPAFEPYGSEGFGDVLARVLKDPDAAWAEAGGAVGRSQFRPVSLTLTFVERRTFRAGAAQGAALVSLLLHLGVVLLTVKLLAMLDAPRAARWLAATVVAASPAALTAAAWPAHQAIVLATALGLAGVVVGIRGGAARGIAAGVLLAAAGLSHELAWGFTAAYFLLRVRASSAESLWKSMPWAGLIPAAAGLVYWIATMRDAEPAADQVAASAGGREALGRVVGVVHAAVSAAVPARMHFADGPWTPASFLWGPVAVLVVLAAIFVLRRSRSAGATLGLAAVFTLGPALVLAGMHRTPSGAPFHDGYLYLAMPFLAGALAWGVAHGLSRGGALRTAAAVAGALWIGAHVAATATRAGSFRTRAGHLALAVREMPDSPVVEGWSLDAAISDAVADKAAAPDLLRALAPRAEALGARATGDAGKALAQDPVAAVAVAASLARYGVELTRAGIPPGDPVYESAEVGCAAGAELLPHWVRSWIVLATVRDRTGSLQAARDAARRAAAIAPTDPDVISTGVRTSLALGDARFAVALADQLFRAESEKAQRDGRRPRPEIVLLCARANRADGAARVPDPLGGPGVRARYEVALALLRDLIQRDEMALEAKRELAVVCLLYGDALVSIDRTALALLAYAEGDRTGVRLPELTEHRRWLTERLQKELAAVRARLAAAGRGEGNVAVAFVELARAYSRMADWGEAEKVFEQIEKSLGMSPELRYHRALLLWRERDPRKAVEELRTVVRESPSLARAHFELGSLLAELGDYEGALERYVEARRLGVEQAEALGAEDWLLDADQQAEFLDRLLREQSDAK